MLQDRQTGHLSRTEPMIRTNNELLSFIARHQEAGNGEVFLRSYAPGTRLIRQGQDLRHVFILREGITKCYITEENTRDYIVEFLGTGEVLGEIELIRNCSCLTNVEAITPVTAYCIPPGAFNLLLEKDARFNRLLLEELATRVTQTAVRAAAQQLFPVEYVLLRLLALQQDQQIVFSKQDMADYLAISLRSFNRIIRQLRDKGILGPDSLTLDLEKKTLKELLRAFEG